jgi:hypothetical protein
MEATDPIFLGLDLAGLITLPAMLMLFGFAVWFGATQCSIGINAEEQARRTDAPKRF